MSKKAFRPDWERKAIAIDFDGPCHSFSRGYVQPDIYDPPVEGVHNGFKRLLRDYAVYILTARNPREVIKWCRTQFPDIRFELVPRNTRYWEKIGVVGVTNVKLPAIAYVDDHAVRFVSWRDTLAYFL